MKNLKIALRKEIKKKINALSYEEKLRESEEIFALLEEVSHFKKAETILLFWSLPDEVFTHEFVQKWSQDKRVLLPVVVGDQLEIREFTSMASMKIGAFGILEPIGEKWTDMASIDLAIIPGVGFDPNGNRLGRGKGYYDKLLPSIQSPKYGICFSCQIIDTIPTDEWDITMNGIISPTKV